MNFEKKNAFFYYYYYFFKDSWACFGGFDSGGTQSKAKLSIENKMNPDVLCQLRGIKKRKKKKQNRRKCFLNCFFCAFI